MARRIPNDYDYAVLDQDLDFVDFVRDQRSIYRRRISMTTIRQLFNQFETDPLSCPYCIRDPSHIVNVEMHESHIVHFDESLTQVLLYHPMHRFAGIQQYLEGHALEVNSELTRLFIRNDVSEFIVGSFDISDLEWSLSDSSLSPVSSGHVLYAVQVQRHDLLLWIDMLNERIQGVMSLLTETYESDISENEFDYISESEQEEEVTPLTVCQSFETDQCSICHNLMNQTDTVSELSCNHVFHMDCIAQWFQSARSQSRCPLCRSVHS